MLRQSKRRMREKHWGRFGPTYLTILAAVLVMADNFRHVLQDGDIWPPGPWPGSSQYYGDCSARQILLDHPRTECSSTAECPSGICEEHDKYLRGVCTENAETFACLTPVGWAFTVVATYLGFVILFLAAAWNAKLLSKLRAIRTKWRALRAPAPPPRTKPL